MTTDVIQTGVGTTRAGFIGSGFMAEVHSRATRAAGAAPMVIASTSAAAAQSAAARLGIQQAADNLADILATDADVIHVCTPNATHYELAAQAIRAGKHVICEKPLATNVADATALVQLAHDAGVVGAVPFVYRYHPMVREARERVANGELGDLLTLDCAYLQDWLLLQTDANWRATSVEGGASRAFADIGSHMCDLVEFITGERIVALTARTRTVYAERGGQPVANEDIAALLVELQSGAIGTLLVSQMAAGRGNALVVELHGKAASVRFEQEQPETLWWGSREGNRQLVRDPKQNTAAASAYSRVPTGHPMGYQDAFNAFIADAYAAMSGETPDGLPTFADGLRAAQLTEAVLQAAHSKTWVEVAP